ncbi:MAG TPA: hypothetical protein VFK35_12855 [Candidatus Limnocylindrales bacterium]|nr:hypothetical protein [Candidatus Limnocylindrales bacterium]
MFRALFVLTAVLLAAVVAVGPVRAGSPNEPTRGVLEPATDACPWPDFYNQFTGALKCLPTAIPWSEVEHDGVVSSGARIVADPMTDVAGGQATGSIVFWCQFRAGFSYQIRVTGLDPLSTYSVHAVGGGMTAAGPVFVHEHLGDFRTDANGRGGLNGVLTLDKGGYGLDVTIFDGSTPTVSIPDDDLAGFAVL